MGNGESSRMQKGYLQTDGYAAYEVFAKRPGITLLHCMAHARRMFHDALDNNTQLAEYALQQIQALYAIERRCREQSLSYDKIRNLLQTESLPILQSLGGWMKQQYVNVLPQSGIGKVLGYSIERWARISEYVNDGRLHIDNNPVENSIRPVALGRKNYLFAGSHCLSRTAGKQPNAVACSTPCSVLAKCMVWNLMPGLKMYCTASPIIPSTALPNYFHIATKNNPNFKGAVGRRDTFQPGFSSGLDIKNYPHNCNT